MPNVTLPALAVVLALSLSGCSGDGGATPGGEPPSAPASSAQEERYAVELALLEEESTAPGAPSGPSTSPGPTDGSLLVTVTNAGKREDSYLLRLVPPDVGGVAPTTLTLAPGQREVVRVVLDPGAQEREVSPEVTALSRARGEILGTLELPG